MEATIVLLSILIMIVVLIATNLPADIVFFGILGLLMTVPLPIDGQIQFGVISTEDALSGFSNAGMITIAFLYVVAHALKNTGSIDYIGQFLIGEPKTLRSALSKITFPIIGLSAVFNNTPLVSIMIPVVSDLAKKFKYHASKLMIPLSYAAILGGTCSLIGTSTNLVVNGLIIDSGLPSMGIFDIAIIGIPSAIIGGVFLILFGPMLLPERGSISKQFADPKEYTVEMMISEGSNLIGKTIEEAGLRNLPEIFLAGILRDDEIIAAINPKKLLKEGDRLLFTGIVDSIKDLQNFRGLVPATNQVFKLDSPRYKRQLFEVVISNTSHVVGKTIKDAKFRNYYGAVVLAVGRNGERINKKIGEIILRGGDTLLIETNSNFESIYKDSRDFYLVRQLADSAPRHYERAKVAILILALMITSVAIGIISMLKASMIAAILMVLTRCCTLTQAKKSIDVSVLLIIASALGIGRAIESSGVSEIITDLILQVSHNNVLLSIVCIYMTTSILTAFITNNAAVALTFPIAMMLSSKQGISLIPFAMTIMMAGSASFATPYGYQTNLMVFGPGGYKFRDYLKIGIPMNILIGVITIVTVKIVFNL